MVENKYINKEVFPSTFELDLDFKLVAQIKNNGYQVEDWIDKCINLGLEIEGGKIFQELGIKKEKEKISMNNFNPYPQNISVAGIFNIPQKSFSNVQNVLSKKNIIEHPKVWIGRAITLGVIFPNAVFFKKTSKGWKDCTF